MKRAGSYIGFMLLVVFVCCKHKESNTKDDSAAGTAVSLVDTTQAAVRVYDLNAFIPKGYSILDSAKGDLNLDAYPDYILIIKKDLEDSVNGDMPLNRSILLITGLKDNTGIIKEKSDHIIWPLGYGGGSREAYRDVRLNNGAFMIEHQGGNHEQWTLQEYFTYSPSENTWYLEKSKSIGFDIHDLEAGETVDSTTSSDFGFIRFNEYNSFDK